jgi:hypothetical protein
MFTEDDVSRITGRWVRLTRTCQGEVHTHLVLVERAWLAGTQPGSAGTPDGGIGAMVFEPNTPVPFTSFHVPADSSYEVLDGCAPVPIKEPSTGNQPHLWRDLRCPSGPACTCIAATRTAAGSHQPTRRVS